MPSLGIDVPTQYVFNVHVSNAPRVSGLDINDPRQVVRYGVDSMRNAGWNMSNNSNLYYAGQSLTYWLSTDTIAETPTTEREKVDISSETLCYCEACKQKRYETNGLAYRRMHNYSYTPARWRMHAVPNDKFPYHMGVELETTAYHRDHLDNGYAVDMRRPKQFWIAKRDGSVTGPEFCSHPATLTWWHDNEGNLRDMFKMLAHAGFTSHNGGQAGMHVNISKDAFTDSTHLHRFLTLLTMRPDWSITMAQRSYDRAMQWARIYKYEKDTCDAAMMGGRYLTNKYSVINMLRNRYEFRLPRGTIRIDRFMKNLEWTAAMIGFTRSVVEDSDINIPNFTTWVGAYPNVYSNLLSFMDEKRDALTLAIEPTTVINSRFAYVTA